MFFVIKVILAIVVGYLLGSLNTSIIVGKFYGIDVREHGSGNAGMTNALRTLGKAAAIWVIVGDILKGVFSCLIGSLLFVNADGGENIGTMIGGLGAVLGHNWPLYFGFKGGKGILTTFSVILMMDYKIGLILFSVFLVVVAISRYISLGSIIACFIFPLISAILDKSLVFTMFSVVLASLAIARHHGNVKRLLDGTESKFGVKKQVQN